MFMDYLFPDSEDQWPRLDKGKTNLCMGLLVVDGGCYELVPTEKPLGGA